MKIYIVNSPMKKPKFVLTSVLTKFVDGNMVNKASIIVVINTCLSFDFTSSTLNISEFKSNSGPAF